MYDDNLVDALANDDVAQRLAGEQAAKEQIHRLTLEEQAALLDQAAAQAEEKVSGMTMRFANPKARTALRREPVKMEIYKASELYGKELERTPMIVPNMIPAGLTVLAGAPKRGKSWLALALAIAVADGKPFLGRQCRQGDVLYLDLESRKYRVQDRLSRLLAGPAPDGLYITHDAAPLGEDLYQELQDWCDSVEHPTLVIIDTLGRVRAGGKKSSENAYESDTRMYGDLQKWGAKRKLAVLVVHHLRKVKDSDDWFDRINGSNGLVGVADTVLGLGGARNDDVSKLMISGRDIEGDYELMIRFKDGQWLLESQQSETYAEDNAFNSSPTIKGIYRVMQCRAEWQGTAQDLIEAIQQATNRPLEHDAKAVAAEIQRFKLKLDSDFDILAGTKRLKSGKRVLWLQNRAYTTSLDVFEDDSNDEHQEQPTMPDLH